MGAHVAQNIQHRLAGRVGHLAGRGAGIVTGMAAADDQGSCLTAFRTLFPERLMEGLASRMRAAPQPLLSPMVILTGLYRKAV